jgi:type IX secretion system substrate protein
MRKTFKILIIQFFLGFLLLLNAQQAPYFNRAYDLSGGSDIFGKVEVFQDSMIFLFGWMEDTVPDYSTSTNALSRLDLNGNVIWRQLIKDSFLVQNWLAPVGSFAVSNNKIVVVSNTVDSNNNLYSSIIAFDFNGSRLWQKKLKIGYLNSIKKNRKGYIASGYNWGDSLRNKQTILVQFDSNANIIWEKNYNQFEIVSIVKLMDSPDGGILAGCIRMDTLTSSLPAEDPAVVKTDSAGNIEWITDLTLPNSLGYNSYASVLLTLNGYIIAASGQTVVENRMKYVIGLLTKLNLNGEIIWQKQYGKSWYHSGLYDIVELKSGSYMAVGYNSGLKGRHYGWMMTVDTSGKLLWERLHYFGDAIRNILLSARELYDHTLVAAGYIEYSNFRFDLWSIRTDELGCLAPMCDSCRYPLVNYSIERKDANTYYIISHNLTSQRALIKAYSKKSDSIFLNFSIALKDTLEYKVYDLATQSVIFEICVQGDCNLVSCITDSIPVYPLGIEESYFLNDIKVFPNPFSQVLQINFGQPAIKEMELQIIDISGRMLLQKTLPSGLQSFNVTTAAFPLGIYLYRIGTNELGWKSGKVVKTNFD